MLSLSIQELEDNLLNIYSLYENTFDDDIRTPWKKIEYKLQSSSKVYVFMEELCPSISGKIPSGLIIWTPYYEKSAVFIDYFCISKEFQGRGLGRKYFQQIVSLFALNFQYILLDCKSDVVKFYQSFGFKSLKKVLWNTIPLDLMIYSYNHSYNEEDIMKIYSHFQ